MASQKGPQNGKKSLCAMGYSLWYVKIDLSQELGSKHIIRKALQNGTESNASESKEKLLSALMESNQ